MADRMISKNKRTGILRIFATDVDPGNEYIENFQGGVQKFMKEKRLHFKYQF